MSDQIHPMIFRKMDMIVGGKGQRNKPITAGPRMFPPCFESRTQYSAWLDMADPEFGVEPPTRKDWPGEPNYCRDCTSVHRNEMRKEGLCLFPDTVFVTVGADVDEEIVGTTS